MKLLFERLSHEIDWDMKDAVRESVSQLTATAMLENRDVPPGILNFGVPQWWSWVRVTPHLSVTGTPWPSASISLNRA